MPVSDPPIYLDTSALMRWAESDVSEPRPLNARTGPLVDGALAGASPIALSELTLIEYRMSVTRNMRMTDAQSAAFDAGWATRSRRRLFGLIAEGRIEVVTSPARVAEHAMTLVDLAADEHNQHLGMWDAIHLLSAAAWAQRRASVVELWTSDPDYDQFCALYPHFERSVKVFNLDRETA